MEEARRKRPGPPPPKQSTKQEKLQWLLDNRKLWHGLRVDANDLWKLMVKAGLYSPNSNAKDVEPTIERIVIAARERLSLERSLGFGAAGT